MAATETGYRELLLAAQLMARPDLTNIAFPIVTKGAKGADLRILGNPVARAAVSTLSATGGAYSNPLAMQAALADMRDWDEAGGNDIVTLTSMVPDAEEVTVEGVVALRTDIERTYNTRELQRKLAEGDRRLRGGEDVDTVLADVNQAIRDHQDGIVGYDPSAAAHLDRATQGLVTTRWKAAYNVPGGDHLDDQERGINKEGEFSTGMLANGEIVIFSAAQGTGKTRTVLNWTDSLLEQGASVSWLCGEDTGLAYLLKLIGMKFGLHKWELEYYLVNKQKYLDEFGRDRQQLIEMGLQWGRDISKKLRLYDRKGKTNIAHFPSALSMMEGDCYEHGTDFWVIDYFQIFKGELQDLESYVQELLSLAGRRNVGVILLSQVSNETQKFGLVPGMVPTKGTGEPGQAAHYAFYATVDPTVGQRELKLVQVKGRNSGYNLFFLHFDVETGHITDYAGSPTLMEQPAPQEDSKPKGKGKRG